MFDVFSIPRVRMLRRPVETNMGSYAGRAVQDIPARPNSPDGLDYSSPVLLNQTLIGNSQGNASPCCEMEFRCSGRRIAEAICTQGC